MSEPQACKHDWYPFYSNGDLKCRTCAAVHNKLDPNEHFDLRAEVRQLNVEKVGLSDALLGSKSIIEDLLVETEKLRAENERLRVALLAIKQQTDKADYARFSAMAAHTIASEALKELDDA